MISCLLQGTKDFSKKFDNDSWQVNLAFLDNFKKHFKLSTMKFPLLSI